MADIDRSSNFKYSYMGDSTSSFNDTLHSDALHNLKGEIGIDLIFPNNYSIFLIYERNQALGSGHTDKIHIAVGYLPNKNSNYAFKIDGSNKLKSTFIMSKNINDYDLDFELSNKDILRPRSFDELMLKLKKIF